MQGSVLSLASSDAMPYPFTAPVSALAPQLHDVEHGAGRLARRLDTADAFVCVSHRIAHGFLLPLRLRLSAARLRANPELLLVVSRNVGVTAVEKD